MFRTREQLLEWLEHNPPTKIIGKAISEGSVELYGLFGDIVGSNPAFIVHVVSPRDREWDVAVIYDKNHRPRSGSLKWVPWYKWMGDQYPNRLCMGDSPLTYLKRKRAYYIRKMDNDTTRIS